MSVRADGPRGSLLLRTRGRGGLLIERRANNIVLRGGAALIANLFTGGPAGKSIDTLGVGFATEPATAELTALTPPPAAASIPAAALVTPLTAASFQVVIDQANAVQVKIAAVFKPVKDLDNVTEAGILAGTALYNQVIFEPVSLHVGQDVTFFWQIDFPFGH